MDDSEFVIITHNDFSDLLDENGSPNLKTMNNTSNGIIYNIINAYNIYNKAYIFYYTYKYIIRSEIYIPIFKIFKYI